MKKLFATALLALTAASAQAAPIVFQGGDPGASLGSATPNANASAALFDAAAGALGTVNLIDFESASLGTFASIMIAPGVTASGIGYTGTPSHSISSTQCGPVCGFNTTSGGSRYLNVNANYITFSFSDGISAFGAYLTGVQLAGQTVNFNDGTSETLTINNYGSGAQFFGFTDAGKSIASIVIDTRNPSNLAGDFIGIDDVRLVSAATDVPEPAMIGLFGMGAIALGLTRRRRAR